MCLGGGLRWIAPELARPHLDKRCINSDLLISHFSLAVSEAEIAARLIYAKLGLYAGFVNKRALEMDFLRLPFLFESFTPD